MCIRLVCCQWSFWSCQNPTLPANRGVGLHPGCSILAHILSFWQKPSIAPAVQCDFGWKRHCEWNPRCRHPRIALRLCARTLLPRLGPTTFWKWVFRVLGFRVLHLQQCMCFFRIISVSPAKWGCFCPILPVVLGVFDVTKTTSHQKQRLVFCLFWVCVGPCAGQILRLFCKQFDGFVLGLSSN